MRGDDPREATSRANRDAFIRHFRNARQPAPISPPPRPWLPGVLALLCAALVIVGSLGPWQYVERAAGNETELAMIYGHQTDGLFSILFAGIAIVATLIILLRPGATAVAWITFGALALCMTVGFFDWLLFAPAGGSLDAVEDARIVNVEWGVKVVFLAGLAGTISSYIAARDVMEE